MPINDTETGLESKEATDTSESAGKSITSIAAALAARFRGMFRLCRSDRSMATLLLYDRFCLASSLNEADAAAAIANALTEHCANYPHVDINEQILQDLRWLLARNHDVSILCGHVRVYVESKKTKHANKVTKLAKCLVMS